MAQDRPSHHREPVRLMVPELRERPFIGAGCCLFPASELVGNSVPGRLASIRLPPRTSAAASAWRSTRAPTP